MSGILRAASAALLVLALVACSGPTPDPSGAPTTEPSPTPTPTPTPDASDPANWLITFDGIGPVEIGDDIATVRAELATYDDTTSPDCSWTAMFDPTDDGPSIWLPLDESESRVDTVVLTGSVPGGADPDRSPRTVEGIGVESTEAELLAAVSGLEQIRPEPYPAYAVGDGSGRWIVFSVYDPERVVVVIEVSTAPSALSEVCG